ncbi:MAG: L,D-transpeptidase family protein [Hyphomicrobium sp.]|uniref:L,D-transpeptidase family protein n=1 Tax=Hyphomicrobium sp. TaxID=82 RepID=UPI0025C07D50|nr:L,D-transpeptidase family protein [Hyphomicrobium sp.]MBZ0211029.1 L,D-transpeptidase family protein [Hyphomicrobium sp.]
MQTIAKSDLGAVVGSLRVSTLVAFLAGGLLVAATPERAEAQFYQWGSWGNPGPWQPKPRVRRRAAPRYIEPTDEKPATALPKPSGPLVLVVSLSKQTVTVYDDGKQIAKSPISSGMSGHPTPTGIFSILEKNRYHYSNLYGGAPMPFMQRVTNSGVAMHAGDLPGYPASHGCIRLPYSFARNLFGITEIGARVVISNEDLTPAEFNSPHLIGPLPPDNVVQNDAATVQAAATGASNIIGVSPAAAGEGVRTRGMAAAQRAAERNRLVTAIVEAENAKAAAEDQAKAATAAAQEAKETIRKERNEEGRLAELARKAAKAADSAASRFTSLTAKMAKVDVAQLDAATLEKQSAEEVAEEAKMLDAADAAAAAKRAAEAQTAKAKQAVADAGALEKARKVAVEDVKQAETVVASAKDALAAADALEARKDYPISVFISGKTGRLVAKLGFVQVMDVPVTISEPGRPLGTHVLTATTFTDGEKALRWHSVTLKPSQTVQYARRKKRRHEDEVPVVAGGHDADPAAALERIDIPKEAVDQLAELMKPGSSFIISDYGLSRETSARTEFVVEPWRSRSDTSETRYY